MVLWMASRRVLFKRALTQKLDADLMVLPPNDLASPRSVRLSCQMQCKTLG
jgi:hypothetical protein